MCNVEQPFPTRSVAAFCSMCILVSKWRLSGAAIKLRALQALLHGAILGRHARPYLSCSFSTFSMLLRFLCYFVFHTNCHLYINLYNYVCSLFSKVNLICDLHRNSVELSFQLFHRLGQVLKRSSRLWKLRVNMCYVRSNNLRLAHVFPPSPASVANHK